MYAALTVLALSLSIVGKPALAATAPPVTNSYYITSSEGRGYSTSSTIYNQGYNAINVSGIIILDFGAQEYVNGTWETLPIDRTMNNPWYRNDSTVENMARSLS